MHVRFSPQTRLQRKCHSGSSFWIGESWCLEGLKKKGVNTGTHYREYHYYHGVAVFFYRMILFYFVSLEGRFDTSWWRAGLCYGGIGGTNCGKPADKMVHGLHLYSAKCALHNIIHIHCNCRTPLHITSSKMVEVTMQCTNLLIESS